MARKLRATHAGIHHVFARSQVDDPLFRDDHDHIRFETELRTICAHEVALTCIAAMHYRHALSPAARSRRRRPADGHEAAEQRLSTRLQRALPTARPRIRVALWVEAGALRGATAVHVPLRCAESGRSRAVRSPCRLALEQLQHAGRPKRSLRLRGSFTGAGGLRRIARDPSRICRGVSEQRGQTPLRGV